MAIHSCKDLIVWQRSMHVAREVYRITEQFPKAELFGLTSQMRRAVVVIPSNIAEGFSRKHRKEYRQFLAIAFSSATELETQLILSKDLQFLSDADFHAIDLPLEETRKMLNKMITILLN